MHLGRLLLALACVPAAALAAPATSHYPHETLALAQLDFLVSEGATRSNHGGGDPQYDDWADHVKVPDEDFGLGDAFSNYYFRLHPDGAHYTVAADGKAAWEAADYVRRGGCDDCDRPGDVIDHARATMVTDLTGVDARPIAWHVGYLVEAKAATPPRAPDAITRAIGAGAEPVAKQFEATIGDPVALARTVSPRADTELLGSAARERYLGGSKVAAMLQQWNLAFTVRDGVAAGLTPSKTVAWVAANLDAVPAHGKGKSGPAPAYRALFVYEHATAGWQLVQASFSIAHEVSR